MTPDRRAIPAPRLHEAADEYEEANSWRCSSCDRMIEEHMPASAKHCSYCAEYWRDLANGRFDYDEF